MTNISGVGQMYYDGRNRYIGAQSSHASAARGYDPANRKIWTKSGSEVAVDFYLPTGEKIGTYRTFVHSGHAEGPPSCTRPSNNNMYCISFAKEVEYTYFAGRRVKTGTSTWNYSDRLGSEVSHLPYGDERTVTGQDRVKFATYWRESSGIDYAMNRYYSSVYGRFLTPDPYRASGGPADPGSWNRYAYVQGDPVNLSDPEGLFAIPTTLIQIMLGPGPQGITVTAKDPGWTTVTMLTLTGLASNSSQDVLDVPTDQSYRTIEYLTNFEKQCVEESTRNVNEQRQKFLNGANERFKDSITDAPLDTIVNIATSLMLQEITTAEVAAVVAAFGGGPVGVASVAFVAVVTTAAANFIEAGLKEPILELLYDKFITNPSVNAIQSQCHSVWHLDVTPFSVH